MPEKYPLTSAPGPLTKSPAVARALAHLRGLLARGAGMAGEPLQSLDDLADSARVSRMPMFQAVTQLKSEGLLEAIRGGRIRRAGIVSVASAPSRRPGRGAGALEALRRDLAAGRFAPGEPFPDVGFLAERCGVSLPTLRKALAAMEAAGELERDGRIRMVPMRRAGGRPRYASVTLVAATGAKGEYGVFSDRGHGFLEALEAACNRANAGLRVLRLESGCTQVVARAIRAGRDGLGYVLWPGEWPGLPDRLPAILEILGVLAAGNRPVAVFDEMGGFPLPEARRRHAPVRVFTIGAVRAGHAMAEELLRMGHKRVAYLSPYQGLGWSDSRFRGMAEAFAQAGSPGGVIPFGLAFGRKYNRVLRTGGFMAGAPGPDSSMFDRILGKRVGKGAARAALSERMRKEVFPGMYAGLEFELLDRWFEEEIQSSMLPVFEDVLGEKGITAWVGANDSTALAALRFLVSRGKATPADISVAGFDDTPASFERGLTSYHFGITGFPQAMLRYLLETGSAPGARKDRVVEIEGVCIGRRTTGPVR